MKYDLYYLARIINLNIVMNEVNRNVILVRVTLHQSYHQSPVTLAVRIIMGCLYQV